MVKFQLLLTLTLSTELASVHAIPIKYGHLSTPTPTLPLKLTLTPTLIATVTLGGGGYTRGCLQ